MNYSGICTPHIVRVTNYSGFCTGVRVAVRSKAGLTEVGMSMDTGFEADTRFDLGMLELLL
jgi:hypothetical protein